MKNTLLLILLTCLTTVSWAFARNMPVPEHHGRVILKTTSRKAGLAPVVFDHWLHRSLFTCRLCHVDLGFAMQAEATGITAELNMGGYYCGACHDGKRVVKDKHVFAACAKQYSKKDEPRCDRCHSKGKKGVREIEFAAFTAKLPRFQFGNAIDWEQAEDRHFITPVNTLENISMKRGKLKVQDDFSIPAKASWVGDIIFSHSKHVTWNGCELCHPEIFPSTEKGTVTYSMLEIDRGQYCGACHKKVAFSLYFCKKCHVKPVE